MNARRAREEQMISDHRQALIDLAAATETVPWGPESTPLTQAIARVRETGQALLREETHR